MCRRVRRSRKPRPLPGLAVTGARRPSGGGGSSSSDARRTWMEKKVKNKGLFSYIHNQRRGTDLSDTT
jgi:hypothetical protein